MPNRPEWTSPSTAKRPTPSKPTHSTNRSHDLIVVCESRAAQPLSGPVCTIHTINAPTTRVSAAPDLHRPHLGAYGAAPARGDWPIQPKQAGTADGAGRRAVARSPAGVDTC